MSSVPRRASVFLFILSGLFLDPAAAAQADAVPLPAMLAGVKAPRPVLPDTVPVVIPAPPAVMFPASAAMPTVVPHGIGGNPQPQTPPAQELEAAALAAGTGAFTYFKNTVVQPAGAMRSTASFVSPCSVNVRDTSLQTGNWYAALSRDTGQTWSHLSPFSFFPALDGGFCCNQRLEYVRSHDLVVWLLQYSFSTTTGKGSFQLAVANGRDELRSGRPSDWTLYTFDPSDFGFPLGTWLDFADLGYNDNWLYVSANVHDTSRLVGAVWWRLRLDDLRANGNAAMNYGTSLTGGGGSFYRFATRAGDGTRMYWAALTSTTGIRIWRHDSIGSLSYSDRTTAPWQNTVTDNCNGPDGRGWLGAATGRIRGACGTATELLFAWTSDGNGGNRPLPFTRVARFLEADRSLVAEHDIYSNTDCWAYAALDSNSLGHIGGVVAIGGAARHVRTSNFLVDGYGTWNGVIAYRMGEPTNGVPGEQFGSFFDVQQSWSDARIFVSGGNLLRGGDTAAAVEPHYTWFGRNDYEPSWVSLQVSSIPITGVSVTIDVTDNLGRKDGATDFTRTFAPNQGYTLTVPASITTGGTTYLFYRWVRDALQLPIGQNSLTVSSMGSADQTAQAQYRARRTLSVDASSHVGSIPVTVSPDDLGGLGDGNTSFRRAYREGERVSLTAPVRVGAHPFRRWQVDSVLRPPGERSIVVTMAGGDAAATALYDEYVAGGFTVFGHGCAGSNGVNTHAGAGTPDVGQTIEWRLQGGPIVSAALVIMGFSNISWGGVPLPLVLPGAPGCGLQVAFDLTQVTTTDGTGRAVSPFTIPGDVSLIGGHLYTQYLSVDLPANALGVTLSNGLDMRVGGLR